MKRSPGLALTTHLSTLVGLVALTSCSDQADAAFDGSPYGGSAGSTIDVSGGGPTGATGGGQSTVGGNGIGTGGGAPATAGNATNTAGGGPTNTGGSSTAAGGATVTTGGAAVTTGGATATGGGAAVTTGGTTATNGGAAAMPGGLPPSGDARCGGGAASGHFQMEDLDRGLVAVKTNAGVYIGWRMLGYEYNREAPASVSYHLYRDGALLSAVSDSTNFLDKTGSDGSSYSVSLVLNGAECSPSKAATPWKEQYLRVPLTPPPAGKDYAYDVGRVTRSTGAVNDGSPGDVDGDGQYEIVVIWQPSNEKDNSLSGHTGPVYMDCYKLDGTRLWRMNLGPNIRAGAHYTQFLVYDFDGDGRAEVAFKTAPGTKDASGKFLSKGPAANDDDSKDYRNDKGYVLSGPEYFSIFDGATGLEIDTANYAVPRGNVGDWGDTYGNRVDRFLASAGFVSDQGGSGKGSGKPAMLMARGYYTRATVTAWQFDGGKLKELWTADSKKSGSGALAGQGAHSMVVADVDGDLAQEIIYGAAMIQSDGSLGCSTGLNHGDALHAGDLIPSRPGLEVFMPQEDKSKPWWHIRDANDCKIIHKASSSGADNGRGVAGDISAASPGAEFWSSAEGGLRDATTNKEVGGKPKSTNFLIWWDADDLRELENENYIDKGDGKRLLTCEQCTSNNHTKATPTLTADLLGDWREEVVWRESDSSALRIYTTTDVTSRRLYTLMHDPQYRMQVSSEMTAYNQPPHVGFHLGDGMEAPPAPDIHVK